MNFTASAISSRSAHLSWLPPPREHHNGLIRHFWINITEINTGRRFKRTLFSTATVLSSLHPYYTYQFSVAAYTVSLGPFTTAFVLKMPQDGETVCYLKQYVGHITMGSLHQHIMIFVYTQRLLLLQQTSVGLLSHLVPSSYHGACPQLRDKMGSSQDIMSAQ